MFGNDYGWIDDESHPIKPKFTKWAFRDICIGLGAIAFGVIEIVVTSFRNGVQAYQQSEYEVLEETGHISYNSANDTLDVTPYDKQ